MNLIRHVKLCEKLVEESNSSPPKQLISNNFQESVPWRNMLKKWVMVRQMVLDIRLTRQTVKEVKRIICQYHERSRYHARVWTSLYFDGFLQKIRDSSALAMELRLSCTNPSICKHICLCKRNYIKAKISTCMSNTRTWQSHKFKCGNKPQHIWYPEHLASLQVTSNKQVDALLL